MMPVGADITNQVGLLQQTIKSVNIGGKEYPVEWQGSVMVVRIPVTDLAEMIKNSLSEPYRSATVVTVEGNQFVLRIKAV